METDKRERALNLIVSLKLVTVSNGATQAEQDNAQTRIVELRAKYEIMDDDRLRKIQLAMLYEAARRAKAEEQRRQRIKDLDAMGRPRDERDRVEAQRDPLGWAADRDTRSHAQKQADLNAAMGKQNQV